MDSAQEILSPRLNQLQQALKDGVPNALEAFWSTIEQEGTPLIEALDSDDDQCLVTFLWHSEEQDGYVLVMGGLNPYRYRDGKWSIEEGLMDRLGQTNLFFKSYRVRKDARLTYRFWPTDIPMRYFKQEGWDSRKTTRQPDPLNPRQYEEPANPQFDSPGLVESILELPDAPPQSWIQKEASIPEGTLNLHHFESETLADKRRIWVYTPAGYPKGLHNTDYSLLLLFDGWDYIHLIPTPTILDNLIHAQKIPPLIAVFVDKADPKTRSKELHCYPPFAHFIADELIPWAREVYQVTEEPSQSIIGGLSAGGEGALYMAFTHPEIFGHVISQDGAFWWAPQDDLEPKEWLARQIAQSERRSISIYLEAGLLVPYHDNVPLNNLDVNRHMRNVLQAKGYPLVYSEYYGGHHWINWRGSLGDALLALKLDTV
ncbi:MAG: alpha/beta hydrolase-fold protein [Chloroflexota bacterium]